MKKVSLSLCLVISIMAVRAYPLPHKRILPTEKGAMVYPDSTLSDNAKVARIKVVTDRIIRVYASTLKPSR